MPYPDDIAKVTVPDSLEAVMINHVGRHGARYASSDTHFKKMRAALLKADSLGTITPLGRRFYDINEYILRISDGRWGALDSLGMAEQRAIASRMFSGFPHLFASGTVNAISSYSPRVMMSMMQFVHQLDRLSNRADFITSTGRVNSPLMRPFDVDADYIEFSELKPYEDVYDKFVETTCPTAPVSRLLGRDFPFENAEEWRDLALSEYFVIAGMPAIGLPSPASEFFSDDEYNALWQCYNLKQYLQRTATTISTTPADIASRLVLNLIETTDNFIAGSNPCAVQLRFGHAETIMPLVSLLRLPGCYYMTNYFDTVATHWRNFYVVPMASNVQMILFRAKKSGRYYLRVDLNEQPVTLIPNNPDIYISWGVARDYMMRCIPLYAQ